MTVYTKPVVRITPLGVGECRWHAGRWSVGLVLEYEGGATLVSELMLPSNDLPGDTATIHHQIDTENEEAFMVDLGYRPIHVEVQ